MTSHRQRVAIPAVSLFEAIEWLFFYVLTCAPLLLRDELTQEYAGVFRSSVLMLSSVSLRPLLTELLSSQLQQERENGQRRRRR